MPPFCLLILESRAHLLLSCCRKVFKASKQHVPCLAHVLNIAVQAILGKHGLGASAEADVDALDIEDDDDNEGLVHSSIAEDDSDQDSSDDEPENAADDNDGLAGDTNTKCALEKLRKGIAKIRYVPMSSRLGYRAVRHSSVASLSGRHARSPLPLGAFTFNSRPCSFY